MFSLHDVIQINIIAHSPYFYFPKHVRRGTASLLRTKKIKLRPNTTTTCIINKILKVFKLFEIQPATESVLLIHQNHKTLELLPKLLIWPSLKYF